MDDLGTWLGSLPWIRWLLWRGSWLVAIVVGLLVFVIINGTTGNLLGGAIQADYRLATQGQATSATVTGVGLPHYGCRYSYVVAGRTFYAAETGCGGRRVGSTLTVRYVPNNPEIASIGDPVSEFWDQLGFNYGVPLFFILFFYFGWRRMYGDKTWLREPISTGSQRGARIGSPVALEVKQAQPEVHRRAGR